ncbi:MAG: glycosyltransferase [Planctomycetes bacterium]|nr:glycosyltransferase [Planctomycetota bacterium]
MRIAHLTSVHLWHDVRILHRMCRHLASEGVQVTLYALADEGWERHVEGVRVFCLPAAKGKADRALRQGPRLLHQALADGADILHFHDPELLPLLTYQALRGRRVIFDIHEDVAEQIQGKDWIPERLRRFVSRVYAKVESTASPRMSALVVASPLQAHRFAGLNVLNVRNFPLREELPSLERRLEREHDLIAYVGGIATERGATRIAEAVRILRARRPELRCVLAGRFHESGIEARLRQDGIELPGMLDRSAVYDLLQRARVGLCLLQPVPRFLEAYPTKLFEYMASELPIVASDFPLYEQILNQPKCGIMVDPRSPEAIALAIESLLEDPELAEALGRSGRKSVEESYTWEHDGKLLIELYHRLLAS